MLHIVCVAAKDILILSYLSSDYKNYPNSTFESQRANLCFISSIIFIKDYYICDFGWPVITVAHKLMFTLASY